MTKAVPPPVIRRLTESLIEDVVSMHLACMGYSLNALLGREHLKYLYRAMARDATCYVGVAFTGNRPTGVISGSLDAGRFTSRLMLSMPLGRLLGMARQLLLHPHLVRLWWKGNRIASPIRIDSREVRAVLTAIVVDPSAQGRGVGRALVGAFEKFLRDAAVPVYRLDTQIANYPANKFYRGQGFEEAARRADSIVFVRKLAR